MAIAQVAGKEASHSARAPRLVDKAVLLEPSAVFRDLMNMTRLLLVIAAIGFAMSVVGFFAGVGKDDVWWKVMNAGWYIAAAALVVRTLLMPTLDHPMGFGIKIAVLGFGFIAFGGLLPKKIDDAMWTVGGVVMVVGIIIAMLGYRGPFKQSKTTTIENKNDSK